MNSKSRAFCFTINNYSFQDLQMLSEMPDTDYLLIGFEVGKSGTEHVQGYVHFHNPRGFKMLRDYMPRAHIEIAKGKPQENYDYCTKDGHFVEFGHLPQQGRRTDLDSLVLAIEEGKSREEIKKEFPKMYFMYKKKIDEMVPLKEVHDRQLYIVSEEKKYDYPGAFMDLDLDTYLGEEVVVLPAYKMFDVIGWFKGFAPRIRRGYEVIKMDPQIIVLYYSDQKEKNYLLNKYQDIIDGAE